MMRWFKNYPVLAGSGALLLPESLVHQVRGAVSQPVRVPEEEQLCGPLSEPQSTVCPSSPSGTKVHEGVLLGGEVTCNVGTVFKSYSHLKEVFM
jgi:hypothetical protein